MLKIQPHEQKLSNGCPCISALRYEGQYRTAILKYKSGGQFKIIHKSYSLVLNRTISKLYDNIEFDYYTGVPTYKKFFHFDQVTPLAKETARLRNSEFKPLLCQSKKKKTQHLLDSAGRESNVKNIFKCLDENDVKGKTILLFDDVVTTGSTLTECSNELLRNGAAKVYCVTVNW